MSVTEYKHLDEADGATCAAAHVVPAVLRVTGPIHSIVDVGGGTGAWLREFQNAGVERIALIDAAAVRPHLVIPRESFHAADLNAALPDLGRFDMAMSLECAEHLRPNRAEPLVIWLTSAADVVLFSAAIPGQGGKAHINEQFPSYWAALFESRGFVQIDVIREAIMRDKAVPWWYRQNLFLYVCKDHPLATVRSTLLPEDFILIHRQMEKSYQHPRLSQLMRHLGPAVVSSLKHRFSKRSLRPPG